MDTSGARLNEPELGKPIGWWPRFLLSANPVPGIALTALLMGFVLWIFSLPNLSMFALAYPCWFFLNSMLFLPILLLREAQLSLSRFLSKRWGLPRDEHGSRKLFRYWSLGIFVISWLLIYFQTPLTCGFALSRAELDRIADEALAQPDNLDRFRGRWAGIYRIYEVKIIGRTVAFCTRSSEMWGFARAPGAPHQQIRSSTMPEEELSSYAHFHFRDFPIEAEARENWISDIEGERLHGDWFVFYSGYWRQKIGWS